MKFMINTKVAGSDIDVAHVLMLQITFNFAADLIVIIFLLMACFIPNSLHISIQP